MLVDLQLVNQRNFQFHPKSADDSSTDPCALFRILPVKLAKPLKVSYFTVEIAASIAVFVTFRVYHNRLRANQTLVTKPARPKLFKTVSSCCLYIYTRPAG
jgi:hypothetical protein